MGPLGIEPKHQRPEKPCVCGLSKGDHRMPHLAALRLPRAIRRIRGATYLCTQWIFFAFPAWNVPTWGLLVGAGDILKGVEAANDQPGDDAGPAYRLREGAARKALRGVPHLLLLRHANRNLGKDRNRKNQPREDS